MTCDPSEAYRVYVSLVRETRGRYFWLMQLNWSWKDVAIFAIVCAVVGALVYAGKLQPDAFATLILGTLVKQPVKGFGQAVKDSIRPPSLPPGGKS